MNNSNEWQKIYEETSFGNKYASSYLVSFFHNRIKPILLKNKPIEKINVLDFACSFGANSRIFAECGMNVFGIDVSQLAIDKARKNVPTGRFERANLLEEVTMADVFGGGTFDLIIASECMYYFTDTERCMLNDKFLAAMKPNGLIYTNMPTYETEMYKAYKDIPKDKNGMVKVAQSGSIQNELYVNLPRSIDEVKEMFSQFDIIDVVTTDDPLYSGHHNVEYHILGECCTSF